MRPRSALPQMLLADRGRPRVLARVLAPACLLVALGCGGGGEGVRADSPGSPASPGYFEAALPEESAPAGAPARGGGLSGAREQAEGSQGAVRSFDAAVDAYERAVERLSRTADPLVSEEVAPAIEALADAFTALAVRGPVGGVDVASAASELRSLSARDRLPLLFAPPAELGITAASEAQRALARAMDTLDALAEGPYRHDAAFRASLPAARRAVASIGDVASGSSGRADVLAALEAMTEPLRALEAGGTRAP